MAITTTPTAGMITAIKNEFIAQFPSVNPPDTEAAIADGMAAVIAVAIEQALTEVKTNADVTGVDAGGDTVSGGVD